MMNFTPFMNAMLAVGIFGFICGQMVGLVFNWDSRQRCDGEIKEAVMQVASAPVEILPPPTWYKGEK